MDEIAVGASSVDRANQEAMRRLDTVEHYLGADYLDPGEKALYDAIAPEAMGKSILDIGVGGGRTVRPLTAISADYTAIDYSPEMLNGFARRYPSIKKLLLDARDMSTLADGSVFLVVFSCAGIDMVDAKDRIRILREIRRVLVPGGAFIFSTHNLEYRLREGDPSLWDVALPAAPTRNPLKWVWRRLRALLEARLRLRNYRALSRLAQRSEDWAILNSNYHDYLTLMHYITLPAQRAQLVAAGFEADAIGYTSEGQRLSDTAPDAFMLHLMARVPRLRP